MLRKFVIIYLKQSFECKCYKNQDQPIKKQNVEQNAVQDYMETKQVKFLKKKTTIYFIYREFDKMHDLYVNDQF